MTRRLLALFALVAITGLIAHGVAVALEDPLIGALGGTLAFLPLLAALAPLIQRGPHAQPARARRS